MYVYVHVHVHVYLYMCVCVCVCVCVYLYIFIFTHTRTYAHQYINHAGGSADSGANTASPARRSPSAQTKRHEDAGDADSRMRTPTRTRTHAPAHSTRMAAGSLCQHAGAVRSCRSPPPSAPTTPSASRDTSVSPASAVLRAGQGRAERDSEVRSPTPGDAAAAGMSPPKTRTPAARLRASRATPPALRHTPEAEVRLASASEVRSSSSRGAAALAAGRHSALSRASRAGGGSGATEALLDTLEEKEETRCRYETPPVFDADATASSDGGRAKEHRGEAAGDRDMPEDVSRNLLRDLATLWNVSVEPPRAQDPSLP